MGNWVSRCLSCEETPGLLCVDGEDDRDGDEGLLGRDEDLCGGKKPVPPPVFNQHGSRGYEPDLKKVLRTYHEELLDDLETDHIMDYMYSKDVPGLSKDTFEYFAKLPTTRDKNRQLLFLINKSESFHTFMEALAKYNQHLHAMLEQGMQKLNASNIGNPANREGVHPIVSLEAKVTFHGQDVSDFMKDSIQSFLIERYDASDKEWKRFQKRLQESCALLTKITPGCVCLTLNFCDLHDLTVFWKFYTDGDLQDLLQEEFINEDLKRRVGSANIRLSVEVLGEMYRRAVHALNGYKQAEENYQKMKLVIYKPSSEIQDKGGRI